MFRMAFIYFLMDKKHILRIIEWALRLNVSMKLTIYALGKIVGGQFYRKGSIPEEIGIIPLGETGSYNLAWTFFGHSQGYILFIGISQLIGAILFLIPRTKLLGGAILLPILLNIIVVDYFFGVAYGALFSACFYTASILLVFYFSRGQIIQAVRKLLFFAEGNFFKKKPLITIGLSLLAFAVVFFLELYFIDFFGYEDR